MYWRVGAVAIGVVALGAVTPLVFKASYFYFAGYVVLQYVVLATAWNILGGYAGYVNFGVGAFFAVGAYTAATMILNLKVGLAVAVLAGGLAAAALGAALGYLTLRLRGVFFAIATLAAAIVLLSVIVNTPQLGGSKGLYVHRPTPMAPFASYVEFLFVVMVALAVVAVTVAWSIEHSKIGRGLAAIRDDEEAAECMGVPVLRLKILATTVSGFLMGIAGAPYPFYITYLEPHSTMGLDVTVNSLAMALIGGTMTWSGPVLGAILLGALQQGVTVTISSEYNLLIVGAMLVMFVVVAPDGLVGLVQRGQRKAR